VSREFYAVLWEIADLSDQGRTGFWRDLLVATGPRTPRRRLGGFNSKSTRVDR